MEIQNVFPRSKIANFLLKTVILRFYSIPKQQTKLAGRERRKDVKFATFWVKLCLTFMTVVRHLKGLKLKSFKTLAEPAIK